MCFYQVIIRLELTALGYASAQKAFIIKYGGNSSKIFDYRTKAELACRNTSGNRAGGVRAEAVARRPIYSPGRQISRASLRLSLQLDLSLIKRCQ